jgi:hypothetical protein
LDEVLIPFLLYPVVFIRGGGACLYCGLPFLRNIKQDDVVADTMKANTTNNTKEKYLRIGVFV